MKNRKERMYAAIELHGENLNVIFKTGIDNITLCKKLFRLENKAHHATTCLCNTNTLDRLELNRFTGYDVKQATEEEQDAYFNKILESLDKILDFKRKGVPVFINHDPRGYALKIRESWVTEYKNKGGRIYSDWGGYGILAPDLTNG